MTMPTLSSVISELAKALGDRDAARASLLEAQQRVVLYEAHPLFKSYADALCGMLPDPHSVELQPEVAVLAVEVIPTISNGHANPG